MRHPSKREYEVWTLLAAGLSNPSIATHLGIAVNTVGIHIGNLYRKTNIDATDKTTDARVTSALRFWNHAGHS